MKFTAFLLFLVTVSSFAAPVRNTRNDKATLARIDKVVNLVDRPDIKVNVVVVDHGGSTDVSPTQSLHFTLYSKGEMFSTDATYNLGSIFSMESARRVSGGIYEVRVVDADLKTSTLRINAINAINAIKNVNCGDEFDCAASTRFSSVIDVTKR
jgi:hypothetical protein